MEKEKEENIWKNDISFLWRMKRRKISWKRKIVEDGMDGTSKALKTL